MYPLPRMLITAALFLAIVYGVVLLLFGSGATHGIGIALLAIGLLAMAVPISPFLRARVRRREAQAGRRQ
jgi:Zn-dependent protease with chaperone function